MAVLQVRATLKIHHSSMAMEERRVPAIFNNSRLLPSKILKDSIPQRPHKVRHTFSSLVAYIPSHLEGFM